MESATYLNIHYPPPNRHTLPTRPPPFLGGGVKPRTGGEAPSNVDLDMSVCSLSELIHPKPYSRWLLADRALRPFFAARATPKLVPPPHHTQPIRLPPPPPLPAPLPFTAQQSTPPWTTDAAAHIRPPLPLPPPAPPPSTAHQSAPPWTTQRCLCHSSVPHATPRHTRCRPPTRSGQGRVGGRTSRGLQGPGYVIAIHACMP